MNRPFWIFGAAMLAACAPVKSTVQLDLGDYDDYAQWLIERGEEADPVPFEADPLVVSANGEVRAVPDIAVIIATIKANNANESRAVDAVSATVNAVQAALSMRTVETGFTALNSQPKYDETCQNINQDARRRHSQIRSDYLFNKRLDDRGDTETKRRPARPRLDQRVCRAQTIDVSTRMVIRVQPASDAGAVLRALGDTGASEATLFGYDFSDFDSLYQTAAQNAVVNARTKAEAVSKGANGSLGELVAMTVTPPHRVARFGPQPTVIRPKRPPSGDGVDALRSHMLRQQKEQQSRRAAPSFTASPARAYTAREDTIVVTGSRIKRDEFSDSARLQGVGASQSRDLGVVGLADMQTGGTVSSNALTMSLMSGPQTIRVSATLSYVYPTLLDGVIIAERDENR